MIMRRAKTFPKGTAKFRRATDADEEITVGTHVTRSGREYVALSINSSAYPLLLTYEVALSVADLLVDSAEQITNTNTKEKNSND